ncbi:ATP-dependent DNA ligase [Candidatus Woesearchaeota archaeon]|nr:ATP-dependent DNA ligase [Candidatus Woesearchaeota archaeon]
MKYSELTEIYEKLGKTSKRLAKTELLSEFLKKVHGDETEEVVLLLQGRVFPAWDEREIGVASQLMAKAIAIASGIELAAVQKEWKKTGDLGDASENLLKHKRQHTLAHSDLTVKKVFDNLRKLAAESGSGSVDRKLQLIAELLTSAGGSEAKYITRTILGELRVGIGEGALRDAIVWANFMKVKDATVAKAAKRGLSGLSSVRMVPGKPVKVMLALKAETAAEALETCGRPAAAEFKYDGFRLEITKDENGNIGLYTRRLENVLEQFPDVAEYVRKHVKGKSFILDAEAVGYDRKTGKYLPFQKISQRIKRKYDIQKTAEELPVEVNVFDVLAYNGKNLINEPFKKRRELLHKIIQSAKRKIRPAESIVTDKEEEIEKFFEEARAAGNEGLMVKNLDAPYKPGARVGHMLKFKKTAENLDLAIIGAEWGEGKRSSWLSSYDLACRKGSELLEIGKASTGLKEKKEEGLSFEEMTKLLKPLITEEHGRHVKVKPKVVIEVGYEEIQKSPSYSSGYALRFPRVVRNRTDEKGVHDINTLQEVERLYRQQKKSS